MLNYVVVCDRCGVPHGQGRDLWVDVESARAAADNDTDWRTGDHEDVCFDCQVIEANREVEASE